MSDMWIVLSIVFKATLLNRKHSLTSVNPMREIEKKNLVCLSEFLKYFF